MDKQTEKKKENLELKEKQKDVKKDSRKDKVIKIKESEYKRLQDEVDQYKDKYLRLYAEFEDF